MTDLPACPRRTDGKPCQRTFGEQRCTFCGRELPLSHPTFVSEVAAKWLQNDQIAQDALQAAAEGKLPPPPESLTCPLCSFAAATDSGCPACGVRFYRIVSLRDPDGQRVVAATPPSVIAAARRIKLALQAEADRAAGIDTRLRRPLVDSLPALLASLASRHDLPMRVVADLLDEVVPMLDLLARVRELVDAAKDGWAMVWLNGFADIRDTLYPDTDVAKRHREERATRAERAAAAEAAEREAWDGVTSVSEPPELPKCPQCDMHMAELAGPEGEHGYVCIKCDDLEDRLQ